MKHSLDILYEDNHLLIVSKPAGMPTQGAVREESLHQWAQVYLKRKYDKPGNVYVGVVSRLDKLVTGAIVLARTSKAAARLTKQFRERQVEKVYLAVCPGELHPTSGRWTDWLKKSEREQRMLAYDQQVTDSAEAKLRYRSLVSQEGLTAVAVQLLTGRKHQIRAQFAARDIPLVGDRKYGSLRRFGPRGTRHPESIGLHSASLRFEHPVRKHPIQVRAPLPNAWRSLPFANELANAQRGFDDNDGFWEGDFELS